MQSCIACLGISALRRYIYLHLLSRRLPWTCAGSMILGPPKAHLSKTKPTLSLSTYMFCTTLLQIGTTVHLLSEDSSLLEN